MSKPKHAKPRNVAFAILEVHAISDGVVYAGHPAGGEFLTIGLFNDMPVNQGDQIMIRIDKINREVAR